MKKAIVFLLVTVMCFGFCACGAKEESAPKSEDAPKLESSLPDSNLTEETDDGQEEESAPATSVDPEVLAKARGYVGEQLSDFIAEFGEPLSSEYASSCLGDGEDGLLTYDGFTVETYKEGDSEEIKYVD